MGFIENLIGIGTPPEQASILSAYSTENVPTKTVSGDLTSTGTDFATALQLTHLVNRLATVDSNTGVKLPNAPVGAMVIVINDGSKTANLWASTQAESLNNEVAGTPLTIAATHVNIAIRQNATNWFVLKVDKETT